MIGKPGVRKTETISCSSNGFNAIRSIESATSDCRTQSRALSVTEVKLAESNYHN